MRIEEQRKPLLEKIVNERTNVIKIVTHMPGLREEDIKLDLNQHCLGIKAEDRQGKRKYGTVVPLNRHIINNSTKATYNNGVLEISLKFKDKPKQKSTSVKRQAHRKISIDVERLVGILQSFLSDFLQIRAEDEQAEFQSVEEEAQPTLGSLNAAFGRILGLSLDLSIGGCGLHGIRERSSEELPAQVGAGSRHIIAESADRLVDVYEDERKLKIIVTLPGVRKKDVLVRLRSRHSIELRIRNGYRIYSKIIPCKIKPDDIRVDSLSEDNSAFELVFSKHRRGF